MWARAARPGTVRPGLTRSDATNVQTIYAWRLADVRRILDFSTLYPDARRVQLATNYRCPPAVVAASARLIEANQERFPKRIRAGQRRAPSAAGAPLLALRSDLPDWPERLVRFAVEVTADGSRCCFLARTRAELAPIVLALVRREVPHATTMAGPFDTAVAGRLLEALAATPADDRPFGVIQRVRAARGWRRVDESDALGEEEHAALDAIAGWAVAFASVGRFLEAAERVRRRLAQLHDPGATIELVTVHGAKGREWPTVVLVGFEEDRFPNRRALVDAAEPVRAIEEERRLAYVAMTRATGRLVLAFDPARASRFLADAGLASG